MSGHSGGRLIVTIGIAVFALDATAQSQTAVSSSAPLSAKEAQPEAAARELAKAIEVQNALLAQLRHDIDVLPPNDPSRAKKVRVLAEVEDRIRHESRRRYVSPATRDKPFADYYHALERRIEDRGTKDFPTANGKQIYGDVVLNLTIEKRGYVVATEVVHNSQNRLLDQKAIEIAKAAGPFGRFSDEMLETADQIVVTSHFHFVHEMASEAMKAASGNQSGASGTKL